MSIFFWRSKPIPVVELKGIITSRPGALNLQSAGPLLERGFALGRAAGKRLVIAVESPGGSPVQSDLIGRFIRRRAEETGVRVTAVIGDVGASGGYWIACAADEIRANPMSIVGSIGVVGGGFGVNRLIERLDIDRRVYTAGRNKARLDPFSPEKPEDVERLKALQEDVHGDFIALVRSRRPNLAHDPELFTGAFWSGTRAVALGLADRVGDLRSVLRQAYGEDVRLLPIRTDRRGLLRRLRFAGASTAAARGLVDQAISAIEERALWSRFGL
jgi:signal peptide peptidase SppA